MKRGLTLIELLNVLAVIALLMALLLPVLSKAKGAVRKTGCINNARANESAGNKQRVLATNAARPASADSPSTPFLHALAARGDGLKRVLKTPRRC